MFYFVLICLNAVEIEMILMLITLIRQLDLQQNNIVAQTKKEEQRHMLLFEAFVFIFQSPGLIILINGHFSGKTRKQIPKLTN